MLATVSAFGEDRWLGFWADLKKNGVKVVEDWNTAYYTEFSGSSGKGPRPIVVSYASSPPAEVIFADPPIDQAPTAAITAPQTCFRQIEFAGILKGTQNRDLAEKWIDFMLSVPYQEDLPLNQFVYPINPQAKLPEAFVKWSSPRKNRPILRRKLSPRIASAGWRSGRTRCCARRASETALREVTEPRARLANLPR